MAPTGKRKSSERNPVSKRGWMKGKNFKGSKQIEQQEKVERQTDVQDKVLLDLSRPIFPLRHFLDEPQQMVEELFRIVTEEQIESMRPHILKGTPVVELKHLFEEQLRKMNPINIKCILEGIELEDEFSNKNLDQEMFTSQVITIDDPQRTSLRLADSTSETLEIDVPLLINEPHQENEKTTFSGQSPGSESTEMLELHVDNIDVDDLIEDAEYKVYIEQQPESVPPPMPRQFTQSQISSVEMELLEMELRARAIKTLLKNQNVILHN